MLKQRYSHIPLLELELELELEIVKSVEESLAKRKDGEVVSVESIKEEQIDRLAECFSGYVTIKGRILNSVDAVQLKERYVLHIWEKQERL